MQLENIVTKSDSFGAAASGLCLVHCMATPFIFVAQAHAATCTEAAPIWWHIIDFLFLGVSFLAVYWSAQNTSKTWVKYSLFISWVILFFVIINEKVGLLHLTGAAIYFPALGLVFLHIYNKKYCQCDDEQCCLDQSEIPTHAAGGSIKHHSEVNKIINDGFFLLESACISPF